MKKLNPTLQFIKRYVTALRITQRSGLTAEIIAIEKLIDKLEIRETNRTALKITKP